MSRLTDFSDAVSAASVATAAANAALLVATNGAGDIPKAERQALAAAVAALTQVSFIASELGLGDDPSEDPLVVTDPA